MTEFGRGPGWVREPRDELTYEQRDQISIVVWQWARSLPPSTPVFEFLGGRIASARDVARVAALRPGGGRLLRAPRSMRQFFRGRADERLYDYVLNVFAVALRVYDFDSLLAQFAVERPEDGPTAAGPTVELS